MAEPVTSAYFIDGFSPRAGLLGVIAFPNVLKGKDTEFTRFYTTLSGQWLHMDFDFDSRSVISVERSGSRSWWILGKRGNVIEVASGTVRRTEQITDAGTGPGRHGYVNQLTEIAGELYVCGYQRQVYKRQDASWQHIDRGVICQVPTVGVSLESMDGTGPENIYAVGNFGEIFHFDGQTWVQCDSPTNVHLHAVRCITPDLVYACGKGGIVLRGNRYRWDVVTNDSFPADFWGVEWFADEVYVAGYGGIGKIVDDEVRQVDLDLGRNIDGYRLRQKDGALWSIGNTDIVWFDGTKWTELICPDNV